MSFEDVKGLLQQHVISFLGDQLKKQKESEKILLHLKRMDKENPDGIKILSSVVQNILNHENETKFYTLKKSNQKLSKVICQDFKFILLESGFKEDDESFTFQIEKLSDLKETWKVIEKFKRSPEEKKKQFLSYLASFTYKDANQIDTELESKDTRDTLYVEFILQLSHHFLSFDLCLEYLDQFIAKGLDIYDSNYVIKAQKTHIPVGGLPITVCIGYNAILGIKMLTEKNIDINQEDPIYNMTPLCLACIKKPIYSEESQLDTLEFFLKHGADPNKKTKQGLTPLGYAVTQGTKKIIEKLLEAGAIVTNEVGLTKDSEIKELLEQYKK